MSKQKGWDFLGVCDSDELLVTLCPLATEKQEETLEYGRIINGQGLKKEEQVFYSDMKEWASNYRPSYK